MLLERRLRSQGGETSILSGSSRSPGAPHLSATLSKVCGCVCRSIPDVKKLLSDCFASSVKP